MMLFIFMSTKMHNVKGYLELLLKCEHELNILVVQMEEVHSFVHTNICTTIFYCQDYDL